MLQRFDDNITNLPKESYCRLKYNIVNIPICPICKNVCNFTGCLSRPYDKTCGNKKCSSQLRNLKSKQTKLERYGDENYSNHQKAQETNLKRYGCKHSTQSNKVQEKIRQTKLKKYGNPTFTNPEKMKQTCLERYGVTNGGASKEVQEKIKQHFIDTYGVESSWKIPGIKEKIRQTKLKKYGNPTFTNPEKMKQTCLERYGVDNGFKTKEAQEKYKQTCLERYGVDHNWKIPGEHDLTHTSEALEKKKQTSLKNYGVEYPQQSKEVQNKVNETKRKNKSFNVSKNEEYIYNKLKTIFNNYEIIRNYNSKEYPFCCDFYIKELNLYIEYNGIWTHGLHPFNKTNINDIELLNIWKEKSHKSQFYKNAIYNWTIRDVNKRNIAKENNLNYLEFFNLNDFDLWVNEYKKD